MKSGVLCAIALLSLSFWCFKIVAKAATPRGVFIHNLFVTDEPNGTGSKLTPFSLKGLPPGDYTIDAQSEDILRIHANWISLNKSLKLRAESIHVKSPLFQDNEISGRLVKDRNGKVQLFLPVK